MYVDEVSLQVCEWEGWVGGECVGVGGECVGMCGAGGGCAFPPNTSYSVPQLLLFLLLLHAPFPFLLLLQLKSLYPFAFDDSSAVSSHSKMQEFVQKLQEVVTPND